MGIVGSFCWVQPVIETLPSPTTFPNIFLAMPFADSAMLRHTEPCSGHIHAELHLLKMLRSCQGQKTESKTYNYSALISVYIVPWLITQLK